MISVVICHVNKTLLAQVKENIAETIGEEYEIIVIDNSTNQYSIFQAYNEGVRISRFPILCFVHEDVLFHTHGWGTKLAQHFKDETIGLVGTIGGTAFPKSPAPWWNSDILNQPHLNLIQHWKELKAPEKWIKKVVNKEQNIIHQYLNPSGKEVADAVSVDGVFFCIRKQLFDNSISFDEQTFDSFHCYDTDICFQVLQANYRVVIVFDILLEHLSLGSINMNWAQSVEKLTDKWYSKLPLFANDIDPSLLDLYNHKALLTYCYWIKERGYDDCAIRRVIRKYYHTSTAKSKYKESLLLKLWMMFGYKTARYPYAVLKGFCK